MIIAELNGNIWQLLFGITAKTGIITKEQAENFTFYKSDLFFTIFPELKKYKFSEFKL